MGPQLPLKNKIQLVQALCGRELDSPPQIYAHALTSCPGTLSLLWDQMLVPYLLHCHLSHRLLFSFMKQIK